MKRHEMTPIRSTGILPLPLGFDVTVQTPHVIPQVMQCRVELAQPYSIPRGIHQATFLEDEVPWLPPAAMAAFPGARCRQLASGAHPEHPEVPVVVDRFEVAQALRPEMQADDVHPLVEIPCQAAEITRGVPAGGGAQVAIDEQVIGPVPAGEIAQVFLVPGKECVQIAPVSLADLRVLELRVQDHRPPRVEQQRGRHGDPSEEGRR